MPTVITDASGDGVTADMVVVKITLPDAGNVITLNGTVQKVGFNPQVFSGTITDPGVPGSGTNFTIAQVDYTAGTLTSKTSTTGFPAPDPNNIQVWQESLTAGISADLSIDPSTTPDSW